MPFDSEPAAEVTARDRMIRLRDFLANLSPDLFDMDYPGRQEDAERGWCSSPACIGGWARAIFRTRTIQGQGISSLGPMLGLAQSDAAALFYPTRWADEESNPYDATRDQAVAVLDHFLATGVIDWSVAADQPAKREPEPAR